MTEPQSAAEQDHPDQPHHMTETDSDSRPTTPEVPPVPGADANEDELAGGADRQPGAPAKQEDAPEDQEVRQPKDEVTSPVLEHLDETIKKAKQAAGEALAPQRE
jgi:hypothetical protein